MVRGSNFNYLLGTPYVFFTCVIQSSGFEWLLSTLFDASLLELEPQATVAHFLCGPQIKRGSDLDQIFSKPCSG